MRPVKPAGTPVRPASAAAPAVKPAPAAPEKRLTPAEIAYTQEELTEKRHNYQLKPASAHVLCIDAYMSGVGSNSCGPQLAAEYQVPEEMSFSCVFELI